APAAGELHVVEIETERGDEGRKGGAQGIEIDCHRAPPPRCGLGSWLVGSGRWLRPDNKERGHKAHVQPAVWPATRPRNQGLELFRDSQSGPCCDRQEGLSVGPQRAPRPAQRPRRRRTIVIGFPIWRAFITPATPSFTGSAPYRPSFPSSSAAWASSG